MASFDPELTKFRDWATAFDLRRVLTVVGTDYRSYGVSAASALNRLSSLLDDGSLVYNRSDGLVKQSSAQLPGAPRTFVHKCHGGRDSLVTSREAYEIAMRFFHGTHRVSMRLEEAEISRGGTGSAAVSSTSASRSSPGSSTSSCSTRAPRRRTATARSRTSTSWIASRTWRPSSTSRWLSTVTAPPAGRDPTG